MSVLQVNQPVTLYLTAYGRPTPVRFCMAGKINYEAVFPYVVRQRQQGVLPKKVRHILPLSLLGYSEKR